MLANLDLKHVLAFDDSKNAVEAARLARTECDHVLVFDPPNPVLVRDVERVTTGASHTDVSPGRNVRA